MENVGISAGEYGTFTETDTHVIRMLPCLEQRRDRHGTAVHACVPTAWTSQPPPLAGKKARGKSSFALSSAQRCTRFLIDECPHESLVGVAHDAGFEAMHVNHLGPSGKPDWELAERIVKDGFYSALWRMELRAGLILFLQNVASALQQAAILYVAGKDLVNTVIKVRLEGKTIRLRGIRIPLIAVISIGPMDAISTSPCAKRQHNGLEPILNRSVECVEPK